MTTNFHGANFKVSTSLKKYVNEKLDKPLHYFSKVSKVDVYFKKEKQTYVMEIVILADDEKFYFSQKSDDVYSCVNVLIKRVVINVKKFKKRQSKHSSKRFVHHNNHMIVTKNIKSHTDLVDDLDVFGHKPIQFADAYLETTTSKIGLLVFRNIRDYHWYIMKQDKNKVFLIGKNRPKFLFFKLKTAKMDFFLSEVKLENNKLITIHKEKLKLRMLTKEQALKKMSKLNFLLYFDQASQDLNVLFKYKKNKVALLEHVEIYK